MKAPKRAWSHTRTVVAATAILLATGAAQAAASHVSPSGEPAATWRAPLERVDDALAQNNVRLAERAWHEAYLAALASWHWKGMIEVGDAYLRIAEVSGSRKAAEAKARQSYQAAFFRARHDDSLDGVLRAAEAFAALGDREVADQCVRLAARIALEKGDAQARDRVRDFAAQLAAKFAGVGDPVRAF